jgi:hypothetical protein
MNSLDENLSPNKYSENSDKYCLKNEIHFIQKQTVIDLKTETDFQTMSSVAKKRKIDIDINCLDCFETDLNSDSIESKELTQNSSIDKSFNNEFELKTQLEIELELIEDCQTSNPKVIALKTIEEIRNECKTIGLTLNTNYKKQSFNQNLTQYKKNNYINFEVESIYESGVEEMTQRIIYLVKWKNWSPEYNTWEPMSHLQNCLNLVNEFKFVDKNDNKDLKQIYHDFYRLKGIIEDICEKKVDQNTALTLLLIFDKISLRNYSYTKVQFNKLRTNLRSNCIQLIDSVSQIPNINQRINKMQSVFNTLIEKLNILNRFSTINQFFEFYESKKLCPQRLNKWQNDINDIIVKENEGQKIIVENLVDCEVPPHNFVYIAKCKTFNPLITISEDPPVYCKCNDCEEEHENCCVSTFQMSIVYTKNGILRANSRNAIYECNKKCECGPNCINRVIQKGRKV